MECTALCPFWGAHIEVGPENHWVTTCRLRKTADGQPGVVHRSSISSLNRPRCLVPARELMGRLMTLRVDIDFVLKQATREGVATGGDAHSPGVELRTTASV